MALPRNACVAPKRGIWYLYYYSEGKRHGTSLKTRSQREAYNRAEEFLQQVQKSDGESLSQILLGWLEWSSSLSEKYKKDVTYAWHRMTEYFGNKPITLITSDDMVNYINYLKSCNLSNTSISIFLRAIRAVFTWALKVGKAETNIFENIRIPKWNIRDGFLSTEEISKLLSASSERPLYQGFIKFLLATGCRRGELYNLKWSDIEEHRIRFTGKTGVRYFPVQSHIKSILNNIRDNQNQVNDYVFATENGRRFTEVNRIGRIVRRYMDKAGLKKSYSTHTLRHTFCSQLIIKGLPIYEVARLAGHSSVKTTERYIHLSPDQIRIKQTFFCKLVRISVF